MNSHHRSNLNANVSRETIARLKIYEALLLRWVKITNLIGPAELKSLWSRHFADSLQLGSLADAGQNWVDMGTGAGFPGLVLAIDSVADRDAHFDLIEPDGRKCSFLREVIRETGANATVHRARAEDVLGQLGRVDIITSRAMAPLETLVHISEDRLRAGAVGLFPKGRGYQAEVTMLRRFEDISTELFPSETSEQSAIVRVSFKSPRSEAAA